jgi:YesN/AraC family two-component response regulator
MKIRWIRKQAKHAVQSKQFWVKHPAAINVTVQAYRCMQKRGTPIGKNKTKMERNYTHRQRSETLNNNSHVDDQPSYMNEHRKTNENKVTQPNAGHPKAYERRRGLMKRRINRTSG